MPRRNTARRVLGNLVGLLDTRTGDAALHLQLGPDVHVSLRVDHPDTGRRHDDVVDVRSLAPNTATVQDTHLLTSSRAEGPPRVAPPPWPRRPGLRGPTLTAESQSQSRSTRMLVADGLHVLGLASLVPSARGRTECSDLDHCLDAVNGFGCLRTLDAADRLRRALEDGLSPSRVRETSRRPGSCRGQAQGRRSPLLWSSPWDAITSTSSSCRPLPNSPQPGS
jgi:hypothetical protein